MGQLANKLVGSPQPNKSPTVCCRDCGQRWSFQWKSSLFWSLRYLHSFPFFTLPIIQSQPKQENKRLYLASVSSEQSLREGSGCHILISNVCAVQLLVILARPGRATAFSLSTLFDFSLSHPSLPIRTFYCLTPNRMWLFTWNQYHDSHTKAQKNLPCNCVSNFSWTRLLSACQQAKLSSC